MSIDRYDINAKNGGISLRKRPDGDFCYYDDIEELESKTQWISVKDRLPESDLIDVLACLKNKTIHKVTFSTISSQKWFVVGIGMIHPNNPVTHWMPLPDKPE